MKSSGGKQKGSEFERVVCKDLSLWVTNGLRKDCFWRSAISGGRATIDKKKGGTNRQAGDICAVSPEGHVLTEKFYIECKHYKNLELAQFFVKRAGMLYNFWTETKKQARKHHKQPMLIAKQNLYPTIVITRRGDLNPNAIIVSGDGYEVALYDLMLENKFQCTSP